MTSGKLLETIELYRKHFIEAGDRPIDFPHDQQLWKQSDAHGHCFGMLDQMVEFVKQGKMEKAFRWLGFIQGVLWRDGIYTMLELREHNRDTPPAK